MVGNLPVNIDTMPDCDIIIETKAFDVDPFGNMYLVNMNNEVFRYTNNFVLSSTLADRKLGSITSIDATNPLRILVFVDDFNKIVWVDNNLSIIKSLDLENTFGDVSAVGTSNDGGLWLFSPVKNVIYKTDNQGNSMFYSNNLMDFGIIAPKIYQIKERDNYVLVSTQNYGLLVFDNFGQFIWKEDSLQQSSYFDGKLIYVKDGHLYQSNLDFIESTLLTQISDVLIPIESELRVNDSGIYLRHQDCIELIEN